MSSWCQVCGSADMTTGEDSSYYCGTCGTQNENYIAEEFDKHEGNTFNVRFVRDARASATENAIKALTHQSEMPREFFAGSQVFASEPLAGGNSEAPSRTFFAGVSELRVPSLNRQPPIDKEYLACSLRKSYVEGIQKILFLQCETLVKDFNVTPLICGIIGPLWLRFVASTRVFEKAWADEAIEVAETRERMRVNSRRRVFQEKEDPVPAKGEKALHNSSVGHRQPRKRKPRRRPGIPEPRTTYGKKCRYVWISALKERIPLSLTLAFSYLACYIARETILPTDIHRWARKGKLPFLTAYIGLSKPSVIHIPNTSGGMQTLPVEAKLMFRPKKIVGARVVELLAGHIAERIGLQLPPVNYLALSSRFLHEMKLPVEKLLVYVYRMYEWYCPSGLWLTSMEFVVPTRVYVMAMIIIVLKVLYRLERGAENHTPDREGARNATDLMTSLHNKDRDSADKDDSGDMEVDSKRPNDLDADVTSRKTTDVNGEYLKVPGVDVISPKFYKVGEVWDAKELLIHFKKMKPFRSESDTMLDNERKLSEYLSYCRDVIHPGADFDANEAAMRDYFWKSFQGNEATKNMQRDESDADVEGVLNRREEAELGHLDDHVDTVGRVETKTYSTESHGSVGSVAKVRNKLQSREPSSYRLNRFDSSGRRIEKKHEGQDNAMDADAQQEIDSEMEDFLPTEEDENCGRKREFQMLIKEMNKFGFSFMPSLTRSDLSEHMYYRNRFRVQDRSLMPVHEDYFIILRVCAKLMKVQPKALYWAVQRIEQELANVEKSTKKFMLSQEGGIASLYKDCYRKETHVRVTRERNGEHRRKHRRLMYARYRVHEGFASEREYTDLILHANFL